MRVAIYTLTMNRFSYTAHCLPLACRTAGLEADWFAFDQGSDHETVKWLHSMHTSSELKGVVLWPTNMGVNQAVNAMFEMFRGNYDLVMRVDNDCEMRSEGWLRVMVDVATALQEQSPLFAISPRVTGIRTVVPRIATRDVAGHPFGATRVIGGISLMCSGGVVAQFRCQVKDGGRLCSDDAELCAWVRRLGGTVGYIEDIEARHYETTDGQLQRYPEYFAAKNRAGRAAAPGVPPPAA